MPDTTPAAAPAPASPQPPSAAIGLNKAHIAALTMTVAGAITQIAIRIINKSWPGFLDEATEESIGTLVDAGFVWVATYYTPHGGSSA